MYRGGGVRRHEGITISPLLDDSIDPSLIGPRGTRKIETMEREGNAATRKP
jgi:hypothetical protein